MKAPLALAIGLAVLPTLAVAHTTLAPSEAVSDEPFKAVFAIPHGCEGQPTTEVHVRLPEGFVGAQPMPKAGWTIGITQAPFAAAYALHGRSVSSGPVEIRWTGGRLEDAWYDEFVVRGTFAGFPAERRVAFPVTQVCSDGSSVAWDETAPAGGETPSLERPAPVVLVRVAAGHEDHAGHSTAQATVAAAPGEAGIGALKVSGGFARAMLPNQKVGGAYLSITNSGGTADRLVAVSTPAAGHAEVHEMAMNGDVMTMRPLPGGIEIPAGGSVELKPGATHLMFTDIAKPFAAGDTVAVTLTFEHAGRLDVVLPVAAAGAKSAAPEREHAKP